jgi:secretion/DNA translocation related TadE-like protein
MKRLRRQRDAQGSVTVVMTAVVFLGLLLAFVTIQVGVFVSERSHASAAADAAALAAADALARGLGDGGASGAAASVASANGARLVDCACDALDATVTVSMHSRLPGVPAIRARAHAVVDLSGATGPLGSLERAPTSRASP